MADKIEKLFPVKVELIPSGGGVFEIVVDKNLIYSKKATGEFPAEGTILEMLGEGKT
ncbi:MAG: Rdx family protein [Desulfuromusa sp.]|nr:Rdx family protein [Desulfuromusa sp.]